MIEIKEKLFTTYYFVIASNKFLLIEEPVEEVLRERVQHYQRVKKPIDFWLVQVPSFLGSFDMKNLQARLPRNCSAIISTDKSFITWLKLRFNNVAIGNFISPTNDIPSPLSSKLT
uniref:hypothetical protein n=1 Tax=Microzonia abyssicola TaxID=217214 RepID=UPI002E75C3E4|nr:hypothetical protein V2497_pgp077 [Syringoderma abyssicola]WAM65012.1 hypothetical protein [Syringoderma abyssicola]